MTDEQLKEVEEFTRESVNGWVRDMFCGPIMQEMINGQTELVMLSNPDLDKKEVKRIVREVMIKEIARVLPG